MRAEYDFSGGVRGKYARKLLTVYKCWLSCRQFTIQTNTDARGKIVWTAPITRRFLGQPLGNLVEWMRKIGEFEFMGHAALREHFLRGLKFQPGERPLTDAEWEITLDALAEGTPLEKLLAEALRWPQDEWGRSIRPKPANP